MTDPTLSRSSRKRRPLPFRAIEIAAAAGLTGLVLGAAAIATPAGASETITYSYDARGRLVQVARSGTVNNNVVTNYTLDKADNRTLKTTTP